MTRFLLKFILSAIFVVFFTSGVANAFSVSPSSIFKNIDLAPGQTFEQTLSIADITNTTFNIDAVDYEINENVAKEFLKPGDYRANGIAKWVSVDQKTITLDENGQGLVKVKIQIPEDVTPGVYTGGILVTQGAASDSQIAITARIVVLMSANIGIENLKDDLSIVSFKLDEEKLANQGVFEFVAEAKNNGNSIVVPKGKIEIYDTKGTLIPNIQKQIELLDGVEVVRGLTSKLDFNTANREVLPAESNTITASWSNININQGDYVAKLTLYYGKDSTELTAQTNFTIKESLYISDFKMTNTASGVVFSGQINNDGGTGVAINSQIYIKNFIGQIAAIIPIAENKEVAGISSYKFDNIEWAGGNITGPYTATLNVKAGDILTTQDIGFFIFIWWQAIAAVTFLALIIFVIIVIVKKYKELKKQLKNLEKK